MNALWSGFMTSNYKPGKILRTRADYQIARYSEPEDNNGKVGWKWNWEDISKRGDLEEKTIEYFADKLHWTYIVIYQKNLTENFLTRHIDRFTPYGKCILKRKYPEYHKLQFMLL